jgi:hypothetical protein
MDISLDFLFLVNHGYYFFVTLRFDGNLSVPCVAKAVFCSKEVER